MNTYIRKILTAFILLLAFTNQAIGYNAAYSCLYGAKSNDVVTSSSMNMKHHHASNMHVLKMPDMDSCEICDEICTCPIMSCEMTFVLPSTFAMNHQYSTFNKFVSNSTKSARHTPSKNYRPPKL